MNQRERLLELLTERGPAGIYVYEIMQPRPQGLGVAQYNARIKELREQGHHIVNTQPGHFVLKREFIEENSMHTYDLEQKLQSLRLEWKAERDPVKKKILEARGKAVKLALAEKAAGGDEYAQEAYEALV